jgi:competence protein ComEC
MIGSQPGGRCDRLGCTAQLPDGRAVALVRDRRAFSEDCARAAVLITGLAAPPTCMGPLVIDRRVLAARGAVALRAETEGFTAHYARDGGRSLPWRPRPAEPPAIARADGNGAAREPVAATPSEADASGGRIIPDDGPAEPPQ